MERYVCVHGHFYQPPRENPWLEAVEYQGSAEPYHDWNERITVECYGPNAAARVLDGEGRIVDIRSNYAWMSFNVGPTLLSWMKVNAKGTYESVLAADSESQSRFSGHGSALAQGYNHMIFPLASQRDKRTQAIWGIRDFEHRFGRAPEGMWLPETAVDLATLEILADLGIRFTILSPSQAKEVRDIGEANSKSHSWTDVRGGRIDPTIAYQQRLPSGRTIALFFYDGPISQSVAFEGVLSDGRQFADRILGGFSDQRTGPQIVHLATDGESYGHHHRHGEMALAYALKHLESGGRARLTVYAEYLELHPPTREVNILENTSWSCSHGTERWRADCGCSSGRQGWNQAWRKPLRDALDGIRDTVAPLYETQLGQLLTDPWRARDRYIDVILDRSPENLARFLAAESTRPLSLDETTTVLQLLELQRNCMLMYTSCGWFFDDISGIESVQILQYAGRAIQLAQRLFNLNELEERFRATLQAAKSNLPEHGSGTDIYEKFVQPRIVGIMDAGVHHAVNALFEEDDPQESRYPYRFELDDLHVMRQGGTKAIVGRGSVTSEITLAHLDVSFGVLHLGDQNLVAGVRPYQGSDDYDTMVDQVMAATEQADYAQVIRLLDKHFDGATYTFRSLFRDEQRRIMAPIIEAASAEVEAACRQGYDHWAPLLAFFRDSSIPLPPALKAATQLVLNAELRHEVANGSLDLERISQLAGEVHRSGVALDVEHLNRILRQTVTRYAQELDEDPDNPALVARLSQAVDATALLPIDVDLWRAQNICWSISRTRYHLMRDRARRGDVQAQSWQSLFSGLAHKLRILIAE